MKKHISLMEDISENQDDTRDSPSPHPTEIGETSTTASGVTLTRDKRQTILAANGYKVLGTVGHGTYATVKVAYSTVHGRNVAIKIISKHKADAEYLKKFLPREVSVMFMLKHPNIIEVLQTFDTPNRTYIIMELAEKGDVLAAVDHKPVSERQACEWFHQLMDGVEYCHSLGIVHRDLKCENLLLDKNNVIKITDFSFAKAGVTLGDDDNMSTTYCGSYAYACPEILQGTPYDPFSADIWSMGVVLFVMLYGHLPYDITDTKVLVQAVTRPPVFPPKPVVSPECQQLIRYMLVPAELRIVLQDIRKDNWFVTTCDTGHRESYSSGSSGSRKKLKDRILNKSEV